MPTVLRSGPFRLFLYAGDRNEPPRIHVERDDCEAKFWLEPVRLERSRGFRSRDINRLRKPVEQHRTHLLEAWSEFFDH